MDPDNPNCAKDTAYPAKPDSEYGWGKLFSEHLYLSFNKNYGLDVRIARYHNIFDPNGTWPGGREKAPAEICRKVVEASDGEEIEIWGDGKKTKSFLYIDECLEGTLKLIRSGFTGSVNIGFEVMVTINQLVDMVMKIAGKNLTVKHVPDPLGVRGRNSDNTMIYEKLEWNPNQPLFRGLEKTYTWIEEQVKKCK